MSIFEQRLIVAGESRALILDYLDSTDRPSVEGFYEYKREQDRSFNTQVRWDSRCRHSSVPSSRSIDGLTIVGLMNNVKKSEI